MHPTRRDLLRSALLGAAALAVGKGASAAERAQKPLKILILGGTGFLGPHQVERALARGHEVTLFNRGKTRAELFPGVEKLRGDRKGNLEALKGRKWDAVIDNSGYLPKWVKLSAELLAPNIGQYLFVSSVSVYHDDVAPDADETTKVQPLTEPDTEEVMKHYGALKAACERTVEAALPGRATSIRPGLIVGPGDLSDRYTYWVVRMSRGGEVLAPVGPDNPVQIIDARDLAAFMIKCLEDRTTGVFNGAGPKQSLSAMLASCAKATKGDAAVTYVDEKFLKANKVGKWDDLKDPSSEEGPGLWQVDSGRAIKAGLTYRSSNTTAADTWAWWNTLPEARRQKLHAGLTAEREREVLAAWHAARKG
jgi:2'-hydroxyisoflavone reductase